MWAGDACAHIYVGARGKNGENNVKNVKNSKKIKQKLIKIIKSLPNITNNKLPLRINNKIKQKFKNNNGTVK